MAKEKVKINQVEAPTLFIGVGGTGCDIVKRVAEMCRPGETANISFVCLDTNVNDLLSVKDNDAKAKVYSVQTSNTQTVGDYLSYDDDAMRNWFPKNAVIYDKTVSEGAGQVRAISRLALNATIKTGKIRPLYDAIDDLFRKDGKAMKQALRIVIVSTSSGGTGSGIALPLAMFTRDYVTSKYPNTSLIVRSLILLPETLDSVIDSAVERDSQRRNAYATIKEINAFMMKGSGFLDVESDLKRYGNLHIDFPIAGTEDKRSLSVLPFDFCFLMDGQDAEDSTLISIDQYKQQAAQALYEQNIGPMQRNAFSVEDNIIKEMSNPGNYGRNRFGAIGAATIRYPYEKVTDYVAYDWVLDNVGGEGEANKWGKYDKAFQAKVAEARKQGRPSSEGPFIWDVYTEKMDNAKDKFSVDLRNKFVNRTDVRKRLSAFQSALKRELMEAVYSTSAVQNAANAANMLAVEIDYTDINNRGMAADNASTLRNYEEAVRKNVKDIAAAKAEALFMNEQKTINEKNPATIEFLMKNAYGDICHPNAMRYMLYELMKFFDKERGTAQKMAETAGSAMNMYHSDAADADFSYGKKKISTFEELCAAEKREPSFKDKINGYNKIYDKLNEAMTGYYGAIKQFCEKTAEFEAYNAGYNYVKELAEEFQRFYSTFAEKVSMIDRNKDDLVNEIKFRKGDSVYNICSSKELLDELSLTTKNIANDSSMLDDAVNGDIFDAVKKNVAFEREIRALDVVEEDLSVDIFDDVLVKYYKEDVRRKCPDLDMNIIEAIAREKRLLARLTNKSESDGDGKKVFGNVSTEELERYIAETIEKGSRLAAPSVQRMRNVESREIVLCAYNKSLLDMRNFRIKELMPKGNAVESISRYELRFFNALYNLTPDKLNKFAAAKNSETVKRRGGLYHTAYTAYSRDIGPDSTKGSKISTHIDKRWDSIAVMPELDFDHQKREMLKIHQAMVYGLLFKAINRVPLSLENGGKMVYKYHNSEDRDVSLTVSNNTPCDEFYEILDSLYVSSFIVSDIDLIKAKKSYRDRTHNANFADTEFSKAVKEFELTAIHKGPTSVFEIPVAYYASLPNSQRFTGEISGIVDAVIKSFEDELTACEEKDDVKFKLCTILQQQLDLLTANYDKYEGLNGGLSFKNNPVNEIIVRKITQLIESTPEPTDYIELVENMKKLFN
ncbi:MAG: hypothetical protein J6B93_01275 [Clostridia bacterium]|nr:hypothetical protein [Clostridia bacterium]